jgi:hypothetical protein
VAVSRAPGDTGTPHADTHGQAEPVFGLAALLGIKLLPRMRTWQDVTFYRVDRETTYQYIDALLTQVVDWDLIERHWQDMMQAELEAEWMAEWARGTRAHVLSLLIHHARGDSP